MNVAEVPNIAEKGANAQDAWTALERAQRAFEVCDGVGSRELWRVALRVVVARCAAFEAAARALLEAEGE